MDASAANPIPPPLAMAAGLDPSLLEAYLHQLTPKQLRSALAGFLPQNASRAEQVKAIEDALQSPLGQALRSAMGRWVVEQTVPVASLVPEAYAQWRPPVRDAMLFVMTHLSPARLAPKLLEQLELPPRTPPEKRLLRLIAKVPGLQKLGQVLARNRHLRPALRNALVKLENSIRDVKPEEMRAIIHRELGQRLDAFAVRIEKKLMSEASVSAVVRFTWRDPGTGRRERGVFKVMKPYIPACFAEDMDILQELAEFFGARHREYGPGARAIPDTFNKVRQLLQHEVDFVREQQTLLHACTAYRSIPKLRVPQLIEPLCASNITAMTEEHGMKVTSAVAGMPLWQRGLIAEQLTEALVAAPLFADEANAIFHGDPHAGNLLYNNRTGELTVLDWALTEHLGREQRRHLAVLVLMVSLRDPVGASSEIEALSQRSTSGSARDARVIRECASDFIDKLPLTRLPNAVDAMQLLERVAKQGVRFPSPLIMFSKALFTLDGILDDIKGSSASMSFTLARHLALRWLTRWGAIGSPLTLKDWMTASCSAALYGSRLWVRGEQALVDRLLPGRSSAGASGYALELCRAYGTHDFASLSHRTALG
jgi:ubiquinone biosynthesis protein